MGGVDHVRKGGAAVWGSCSTSFRVVKCPPSNRAFRSLGRPGALNAMAKKQAASSVVHTYVYGPLTRPYYIFHEVTPQGGVIYRLERGSSNSIHATNLEPDHTYTVVRLDLGMHSSLTVHKVRVASASGTGQQTGGTKKRTKLEDPPPFSECVCGPGYAPWSPCPTGSTIVCDEGTMTTSCQAKTERKPKKARK